MVSLKGRDLLTLQDYRKDEIKLVLETAKKLKTKQRAGYGLLRGKTLAMIFQKPSTRTSV